MKNLLLFAIWFCVLGCNSVAKNTILVTNSKGSVIEGVQIWATFNSSTYAPEFRTNKNGMAQIEVDNPDNIASLSLYYKGSKYSVKRGDITWPLHIRIVDKKRIVLNPK